MMQERSTDGRSSVCLSVGSSFITSHTAAAWSQTANTHTHHGLGKRQVLATALLRSRLSVWQAAHRDIWTDASLVARTCMPGCEDGPNVSANQSHISVCHPVWILSQLDDKGFMWFTGRQCMDIVIQSLWICKLNTYPHVFFSKTVSYHWCLYNSLATRSVKC